jgi:methionine-rich copper-binding protein CopC
MTTRRRAGLAAATASAAALITMLMAGPALAHAYITATTPANGARVATAPTRVTLTFDEPVTHVHVAVDGPKGLRWDDGDPVVVDEQVVQELHPLGPAGRYQVNYRVVSVDGHTVQGSVDFTLTTAGQGTPPPQPASTARAAGDGVPLWLVVPVAAVVVLVAGGWFYAARRRTGRRDRSAR